MTIVLSPNTWSITPYQQTLDSRAPAGTPLPTPNVAPVLVDHPTSISYTGTGPHTFSFAPYASDANDDAITYSLTATRTGITIHSTTGLLTITSAADDTAGDVVVQVSDGLLTNSYTVRVSVSTGELIRFAPGHYIRPGLNDSLASVQTKISTYDSRVKGIICLRYWNRIETSKGVYDWSFFDGVAASCVAAGKTFAFRIQDRVFGSTTPTGAVPSYLVSESLTYYRLLSTPASGAALWRTAAMDYNIDLYKRILTRYRSYPLFVGIAGEESIYGQIEALNPEYTASGYIAQEIRRMQALRAYAPEIPYWLYTNWVTGDDASVTAMQAWFAAARADKGVFVCGGPDTNRARPVAGTQSSDGEDVLRGDVGGVNHRGVYLTIGSTENEEFSRGATAAQIYAEQITDRQANIMSWSTNPSQWLSDAYPYIATHATVSTVPSAMTGLVEVV